MNRRKFLKRGALLVPASLCFPAIVRAQSRVSGAVAFKGAAALQGTLPTGGGGGFNYYSAVFDGSSYETRGADLTGLTDGQAGTISCWIKRTNNTGDHYIFGNASSHFKFGFADGSDRPIVQGITSGEVEVLQLKSGSDQDWSVWRHVAMCWDLNSSGTEHVFVDGVDNTFDVTSTEGQTINYATGEFRVGTRGDTFGKYLGSISELWFTNTYLDISNSTNLEKFRSSGGAPVNLGTTGQTPTGTTPLLYMHNQPGGSPAWDTNVGSGGGFTPTGTITDGGGDKP